MTDWKGDVPPESAPPQQPVYKSKDGFEPVPIFRGFTEIEALYAILSAGAFICGGYVRYMASPHPDPVPAIDIDVYCETQEIFDIHLGHFKKLGLEIRHENPMAVTFHRPKSGPFSHMLPIQIIKPQKEGAIVSMGTMEEILRSFDFTIIRGGLTSPKTALVDADFIHDEGLRLLRIKNIHCPISSTLRVAKYARKGYWMRPMEVTKLFLDWDSRDDEYRTKLLDFLTKANEGQGLGKEEINELEALMRID